MADDRSINVVLFPEVETHTLLVFFSRKLLFSVQCEQ